MDPLYQENILDHYRHPRNGKPLSVYDVKEFGSNPSCGDELALFLLRDADGRIIDIGYDAAGCAISTAAMSMLSERAREMDIDDVNAMSDANIYTLLGVPITPERDSCALLGIRTLREAMRKDRVNRS